MKKVLFALLVLGCEARSEYLGRSGVYFRDRGTELCFAYWDTYGSSGGYRPAVTNVPCTPQVMKMVEREERQAVSE